MNKQDIYFMRLALAVADASKCKRAQYGTVIVSKDGRIVSTGYNGKPRGSCNDDMCYREGLEPNAAKPNCCIHSEANALMFCSPEERRGGTLYVSGIPCTDCALLIMQSGIERVVFLDADNNGHRGNSTANFWHQYGFSHRIKLYMLKKSHLFPEE